jgi:hypothetical protein
MDKTRNHASTASYALRTDLLESLFVCLSHFYWRRRKSFETGD